MIKGLKPNKSAASLATLAKELEIWLQSQFKLYSGCWLRAA
jgi:hypothetical protein